jgi:hypothetical protein
MELLDYSREGIERAVADGDMARAAHHLEGLRRDVARTAAILAELETRTASPRQFPPGSPEPGGIQVRHGGVVYSNMSFLNFDPSRRDHWESTDGTRHTWLELTEMADGDLTEVPREHIHIPHDNDPDDDWPPALAHPKRERPPGETWRALSRAQGGASCFAASCARFGGSG